MGRDLNSQKEEDSILMMNIELTPKEESKRIKVQDDIHYCLNCQARDGGDWLWIMGERYDLEDLFNDHNVKENMRDRLIQYGLHCKYCGTELNRYDEIGLEDKFDKEINKHLKDAKRKYGKRINELNRSIKCYPTLALSFPLAKSINKEIKEKKMPVCSIEGDYYRVRKVSKPDVLNSEDFLAPPIGMPQEGRFNHSGQSHFYIANSKNTAISEVIYNDGSSLLWLQKFVLNEITNILDLSFDWENLGVSTSTLLVAIHDSSILSKSKDNKDMWKPNYNITRFIMDCAKCHGYSGIKYNSVHDSIGKNIVLFNCEEQMFKEYGKPEIIIHREASEKDSFDNMINEFKID